MSSSEESVEANVQVVLEVQSIESSVEPPMEEWSSLLLDPPYITKKRRAYEAGFYEPPSPEICTKYIPQSDSSVFRHPYFSYPSVLDPGIEKALYEPEDAIIYSDDGQDLYLAVCKEMNQCPVKIFHRSLLDDKINLKYYCVHPDGVRPMAMALQFNKYVQVLDLTDNFLNNDACYHLGEMLIKNFTLKQFILSGCRMGPEGVKRLLPGLLVNRGLRLLNLNKNQLGDEGGEHIGAAFTHGLEIQELYLSYNSLGPKSAAAIAEGLEYHNKLSYLDLSWNNFFSPAGVCALINRLEESDCLNGINLSWCALTGLRIGQSLKNLLKAPNLIHVDLSNNRLVGEAIASIIENMSKAKKLVTLNLSYNPMDPDDALALISKMKYPAVKVQNLLLDNVSVNGDFLVVLEKVMRMKSRKNAFITYGDVVGTFKAKGEDPRELLLNRGEYLCLKPKKVKFDIALVIMQIAKDGFDKMEMKDFLTAIQMSGAPLDADYLEEMANIFPGPKKGKLKTINLKAVVEYMKRKWPDRKLPPTPPPEPEGVIVNSEPKTDKGKGKGKGKK